VTRALSLLERAIRLDPTYALAHGNAAMCHHCMFLRAGFQEASRSASIRNARAAMLHGQDDAAALTLAGFSIGMDGHDRAAAFVALEAALAISSSSALTYILGAVMLGWGGDAERAIEWSEQGMRLSPFDPWAFAAYDAQATSRFLLRRYGDACRAAQRAVQANPDHSITCVKLTAALSQMGRMTEAKAAAARVLELQPAFRFGRQFVGVNCAPALAQNMGDALRAAGLPE
jgi:tetratricopeptide (TPR) repeat protein